MNSYQLQLYKYGSQLKECRNRRIAKRINPCLKLFIPIWICRRIFQMMSTLSRIMTVQCVLDSSTEKFITNNCLANLWFSRLHHREKNCYIPIWINFTNNIEKRIHIFFFSISFIYDYQNATLNLQYLKFNQRSNSFQTLYLHMINWFCEIITAQLFLFIPILSYSPMSRSEGFLRKLFN